MNPKVKATIWYVLTIIFAGFGIAWTWASGGEPAWWAIVVSVVGMVLSSAFGIAWTPPKP